MLKTLILVLFALHPVNVETVLWVSERKGLLAAFFSLLTCYFYLEYRANEQNIKRNLAIILFLLGMSSKASIVMLPVILVLYDVLLPKKEDVDKRLVYKLAKSVRSATPLFIISGVIGLVTLFAHSTHDALSTLEEIGLISRLNNFVVSIMLYLNNLFFNFDYSVFYPYQLNFSMLTLTSAYIIFAASIIAMVYFYKKKPYITLSIAWFFLMLLPVSGLIQTGAHSHADRYMYLPALGIFSLVAGLLYELTRKLNKYQYVVSLVLIGLLVQPLVKNILAWKNTESLLQNSLSSIGDNFIAHVNLSVYYASTKEVEKSLYHYAKSKETFYHRDGNILRVIVSDAKLFIGYSNYTSAIWILQDGIARYPTYILFYQLLAKSYIAISDLQKAEEIINKALEISDRDTVSYYLLGQIYERRNDSVKAMEYYKKSFISRND